MKFSKGLALHKNVSLALNAVNQDPYIYFVNVS